MAAFELARYKVATSKAEALRSSWGAAVRAIRSRYPGLLEAHLARIDNETWTDIWRWETLEAARAAAAGAVEVPEAAAFIALIDEVLEMRHAEIVLVDPG